MKLDKFDILVICAAAVPIFLLFMYWYSKPVCKGKLVQFSQANVEGDMEPFGFSTVFGDLGMNPTVPGQYCIEIRKLK